MKPNSRYILELLKTSIRNQNLSGAKILDFGCGVGEVVGSGLGMSLDIFGADTFDGYYENWKDEIPLEIKDRISQITPV